MRTVRARAALRRSTRPADASPSAGLLRRLIVASYLRLSRARQRPAAGDRRRRVRPRLRHAAGQLARRRPTASSASVEQILRATPEVESTSRRTGLELGLAAVTEANTGDIAVKLKRKRAAAASTRSSARSATKVKAAQPVLDVEFIQVLQDMIGDLTGAPEPVVVKLFSPDPELLSTWAPQVARRSRRSSRASSTSRTASRRRRAARRCSSRSIREARRAPASRRGARLVATAIIEGEPATTPVIVNERPYTLRVRFPASDARVARRDEARDARQLDRRDRPRSIRWPTVEELPGQTEVRRENLQRERRSDGAARRRGPRAPASRRCRRRSPI